MALLDTFPNLERITESNGDEGAARGNHTWKESNYYLRLVLAAARRQKTIVSTYTTTPSTNAYPRDALNLEQTTRKPLLQTHMFTETCYLQFELLGSSPFTRSPGFWGGHEASRAALASVCRLMAVQTAAATQTSEYVWCTSQRLLDSYTMRTYACGLMDSVLQGGVAGSARGCWMRA